jgi:signal transduction histidine kinase
VKSLATLHLTPRRVAVICAALVVTVLVVTGLVLGQGNHKIENLGFAIGIAVPFTILGGLVLASVPGHPVGRLMTASGLLGTLWLLALSWTVLTPMSWLAQWVFWPSLGLIGLAVLVFPDGKLPSRRWWPVAALILGGTAVGALLIAAAALDQPRMLTVHGSPRSPWAERLVGLFLPVALVTMVGYLGALASLAARWRHADTDTRRQLTCLLPAGILMLLGLWLDGYGLPNAWALTACAVPLGMAVAILRYRLYDVDLIINRTIVWLLMTAIVVLGVAAIVKILSNALFSLHEGSAALLATGLAVVTFEPLHARVQHSVDHLLYGDRDDPYVVIARLGEVLRRTVDAATVMPLVTSTIAQSLQVPYVGVELEERDGSVALTEYGRHVTMTESFDMVSHGQRIGRLMVGRRSNGSRFSRHECRLLGDVAVQAAVAAEATRLNRDLQASRQRLVTGREEERRRLRRDLHDGLGPSLAGMSMQTRAALRELPEDSRAHQILEGLAGDLRACAIEVRQLVDELRPPALDRGLEEALRAECARFSTDDLSVHCTVEGTLEGLPAAVEVAALRIVAEALTNVARHSGARTCRVAVTRNQCLTVVVTDDGAGIPATTGAGVGLGSMRERAAELGGECTVGAAPGGGTFVHLELPLELSHAPLRPQPPLQPVPGPMNSAGCP